MNKKIKIAYLITGLNVGGAEANLRDLAAGLDPDSFESIVISTLPPGRIGDEMRRKGIRVFDVSGSFKYDPRMIVRLVRVLRNERPDILHTQLFHADILGRIVRMAAPIPVLISSIQNMTFGGRLRELILAATSRMNDKWIAVSRVVLQNAAAKHIARYDDSVIIHNAVDIDYYGKPLDREGVRRELGITTRAKILVATGRLIPQKGFHDLLRAMHILESQEPGGYHLFILGEGPLRKSLEDRIAHLGLGGSVTLVGSTPNVRDYLKSADAFVMASHWEGGPVALVEAMAANVLFISTPIGAVPEFLIDGENGFQVPIGDPQALAETIRRIETISPHQKLSMTQASARIAREMFSKEVMIGNHQDFYRALRSHT